VLRSQGQIGAERLRHVLVEICGKGQRGVQIEHQTTVQRGIVHEEDVVVLKVKGHPYNKYLKLYLIDKVD